MIKVKPAEGLRVRDPLTHQVLPIEGAEVTDNNFWRRRLAAGDVVLIEEAAQAEAQNEEREEHHDDHVQPDSK